MDDRARAGRDEVPESIGGNVATEAFVVGAGFEDIGGLVGIALEERHWL